MAVYAERGTGPPDVAGRRPRQETAPQQADLAKDLPGYRHGSRDGWRDAAGTAYDRIVDRLRSIGKRVRPGVGQTMAQCPSHDDREASLAIYRKPGKVKLVCFAGCHDELDILPALGLTLPDLWDNPRERRAPYRPDPDLQARIEARRNMTPVQRAVDDLLQLPDLGERISRSIVWHDNAERLRGDGIAWQNRIASARHEAAYWLNRSDRYVADDRHQMALACRNKAAFVLWDAGDGDLDG
jgi:hypothetical protein